MGGTAGWVTDEDATRGRARAVSERRWGHGVEAILAAHARGLWERLVGFFRSRVGSSDAEDLTQETWARALASGIAGARSPEAYIMGIARNVLADHLRLRAREHLSAEPWTQVSSAPVASDAVATGSADRREDRRWLEGWLTAQPSRIQELYRRRIESGESQRGVARRMGLSHRQIRTMEARMLRSIRQALGRQGVGRGVDR